MRQYTLKLKSYIQPFERELALAELRSLAGAEPKPIDTTRSNEALHFSIQSRVSSKVLLSKLAYWESITAPIFAYTEQVLRETTVIYARSKASLDELANVLPLTKGDFDVIGRRSLRYGSHGIHEYRGKYFPQLVRAILNASDLPRNAVVADPMSGSGTTAVEASQAGFSFIGSDFNPLSVFMGRAKCSILKARPAKLQSEYLKVLGALQKGRDVAKKKSYFSTLALEDQEYLNDWFARKILRDLDLVVSAISSVEDETIRSLFQLSLSNILREVSWQKLSDLRVRKEDKPETEIDVIGTYLTELERSVRLVFAYNLQTQPQNVGSFLIKSADAREFHGAFPTYKGKVDVIVTSPPYATALPYLDTDRLSLIYLGLLSRGHHRTRDQGMIGNREITKKQKANLWQLYQAEKETLPANIVTLIDEIHERNHSADVGFRRKNTASLLAKYFLDMRMVLASMKTVLRKGATAHVVIGDNTTTAGGKEIRIETVKLLAGLGESVGFHFEGQTQMEMLTARDIHQENSIQSEAIIRLVAT